MHTSTLLVMLVAVKATLSFSSTDGNAAVSKDMALTMILANEAGTSPTTMAIHKLQAAIKAKPDDGRRIEALGRQFITKARLENDPGCYKLAEMCGVVLESADARNPSALLLRGHALLAMHRFHEAEAIARRLLGIRQDMVDQALLGDALMEQGRLTESLPVYQAMIDAKPCLPSYSRIAHVRWLKGDLPGAIEVAEQAIACGSYRDPEPMAWVTARLAFYQWQNGDLEAALQTAQRATGIVADYPHALFVRGRVLLAQGHAGEAVKALSTAAEKSPLPEFQWALADAYRATNDMPRAEAVAALITRTGAATDPRSFAIYLATQRLLPERALTLAQAELATRDDIFTQDALAWAQHAAGHKAEALVSIHKALSEGTQDARLFLHAGLIATANNDPINAQQWLAKAQAMRRALLPSEQRELDRSLAVAAAP